MMAFDVVNHAAHSKDRSETPIFPEIGRIALSSLDADTRCSMHICLEKRDVGKKAGKRITTLL